MDIDDLSEHDLIVLLMVEELKDENYSKIKADLPDHEKPDGIRFQKNISNRFVPDITAYKNDVFYILEIETVDSLFDEHSHHQWLAFSDYSKRTNSSFILVVPKRYKDSARDILSEKNIIAEIWPKE